MEIRYRDRETDQIVIEPLYGEKELRFLYENPVGRMLTDLAFRRETLSQMAGWVQRARKSRDRIPDFIRRLEINIDEAERPVEDYETLDAFFTRRLKPEARPIDTDPSRLISPADGRVLVYPKVEGDQLTVKGTRISLSHLLADEEQARRFAGGAVLVVRLAPADYHRFHFPDGGTAGRSRKTGSGLHSVHPVALDAGAPAFANKREITTLSTGAFGDLLLIEVGAMIVGTIVQTYEPGRVERGQEKGMFRFGGSTVILVAEPGRVTFDDDLVESSAENMETLLKMGSAIGTRVS